MALTDMIHKEALETIQIKIIDRFSYLDVFMNAPDEKGHKQPALARDC